MFNALEGLNCTSSANGPWADGTRGLELALGFFPDRHVDGAYQKFIRRGAFGTVPWAEYDRELLNIYRNDG